MAMPIESVDEHTKARSQISGRSVASTRLPFLYLL